MTRAIIAALEKIRHSVKQARIPGNDWKRELALIENLTDAALSTSPTVGQSIVQCGDCVGTGQGPVVDGRDSVCSTCAGTGNAPGAEWTTLSPSVEPAGNGREVLDALKYADTVLAQVFKEAHGKLRGTVISNVNIAKHRVVDAIRALSSPPAADQEAAYLIRKNGMYYRPNAQGYTISKAEAGRYTLEEAVLHSHPNGPDGPRDGITYEPAATHPAPALDGVRERIARIIDPNAWESREWFAAVLRGEHIPADDPEKRAMLERSAARRKDTVVAPSLEKADTILAALPSPSEGESAPASSGAGDALTKGESAAWDWLEERTAPTHPNDISGYSTDDMVDAYIAGIESRAAPLPHDAEGESATVSREGELREALLDIAKGVFIDAATQVHHSWVDGTNGREPDFGEAASDYAASFIDAYMEVVSDALSATPATSTERGR
jgi:hypothetical protein